MSMTTDEKALPWIACELNRYPVIQIDMAATATEGLLVLAFKKPISQFCRIPI